MATNLRTRRSSTSLAYGLWNYNLSLKALGLLYTIFSLSDIPHWEFSVNGLVSLLPSDGKDAIQSAIAELERERLLVRDRIREADGRLGGAQWIISDVPMDEPATGNPSQEPPMAGFPSQADRPQEGSNGREQENPPVSPFVSVAAEERSVVVAKKPKAEKIVLTMADLPEALHELGAEILQFWNKDKRGQRTQLALDGFLADIGRIQADGGVEALREQLALAAVTKLQTGKGWMSITWKNWVEYMTPAKRKELLAKGQQQACRNEDQEAVYAEAMKFPYLFQHVHKLDTGAVRVVFTDQARADVERVIGREYPVSTETKSFDALRAEIDFLGESREKAAAMNDHPQEAGGSAEVIDDRLDTGACPW